MKIYNPVKVFFEEDCILKYANEIPGHNILVLTGRNSSKANGSLDDLVKALGDRNVLVYNEINANPSLTSVIQIADKFRDSSIDVCIGLGGGSSIDAAKAVSILLSYEKGIDVESLFFKERNAKHLPIVAIPTTCGSGSEVTPYSVLTDDRVCSKRTIFSQLYPLLSFVDYKYLGTIPYKEFVATSLDALCHLVESSLSTRANELSRFYSEKGLCLFNNVKEYIESPSNFAMIDDHVREISMAISLLGGFSIALNGTSLPHGLANTIPYELKIPHGISVVIFLPGYLKNYKDKKLVNRLLNISGFGDLDRFEEYLFSIIGPTQVSQTMWEEIVSSMLDNPHKLSSYPYEMNKEVLNEYKSKLLVIN